MENQLNLSPPLKSTLDIAYPLDILLSSGQISYFECVSLCWQLYYNEQAKCIAFSDNNLITSDSFFSTIDLSDDYMQDEFLLKMLLHDGYYVFAFVDEYYLPHRNAYLKWHFMHGNLIFGYDCAASRIFSIAGYGDLFRYEKTKIDFCDLSNSFLNADKTARKLYAVKPIKKSPVLYSADSFLFHLFAFINSKDGYFNRLDGVYGTQSVLKYADTINEQNFNIAPLCAFSENNSSVCNKLRYLFKNGIITNIDNSILNSIEKICSITIALWFKYKMTSDPGILVRVKSNIVKVTEIQEKIVRGIDFFSEPEDSKYYEKQK